MLRSTEQIFFTAFMGLVIVGALLVATDWPVRASIIILLLSGVGIILVGVQLVLDLKALRGEHAKVARPTFEVQAIEHQGRWGSLEIWAWLWGLFFAIHLIGFPIALPAFVFLYIKLYGGGWLTSLLLTAVTWTFLYIIYERLLSVPWPKPWIALLWN
jgi:Tripartite tricarboxylate transporter TctB family